MCLGLWHDCVHISQKDTERDDIIIQENVSECSASRLLLTETGDSDNITS